MMMLFERRGTCSPVQQTRMPEALNLECMNQFLASNVETLEGEMLLTGNVRKIKDIYARCRKLGFVFL